jgi:lysophospholipase L1-like esterase
MSRFPVLLRGALALGAMLAIAACADADRKLLLPATPAGGDLFRNYVAMGNSITAGFQSGGINDSTQRQSYAFLLAQQAGTHFGYPAFNKSVTVPVSATATITVTSGCPPLLANWATQKTTDSLLPPGAVPCALRDAGKTPDVLSNVAVPGAFTSDLLVTGPGIKTPATGAPQTLILGGKSQVDRALDAEPTFLSLWIGNNETLQPASVGLLGGYPPAGVPAVVPAAEFTVSFNNAVDSLVRARPALKGILIGAVKVANVPRFFSADSLGLSSSKRTAFGTFTGKGAPTVVGCGTVATGWLVSIELAKNIRSGAHPNLVSCLPTATPGAGDIFMLDPAEQASLDATVDAYNATISAKATELGWAYFDPNPMLLAQRAGATPAIPAFPNLPANRTTNDTPNAVFGALFSLDGAHPSAAAQRLIATAVIDVINAKYNLSIPQVP